MKWIPDKLGAEPRKVAILSGLVVVLGAVYFINRGADVPQLAATTQTPAANPTPLKQLPAAPAPVPGGPLPPQRTTLQRRADTSIQDFKPTLKLPEGMDVSRIDPSLKLDLLARLQELEPEGGERSVFDFGAAPKPKTPTPVVAPVKPEPIVPPGPPVAAGPPKPPAPPPIPLKFYGYVSETQGPMKRAFFLDGDDIVVAGENEMIHNRFRVVRIGVNSAIVEDTLNKTQQTLPLVEELAG